MRILNRAAVAAILSAVAVPGIASAQNKPPQDSGGKGIPTVLFGVVTYGRPLQLAGGGDVLFLIGPTKSEDGVLGSQGIIAGGSLGLGGWQVSAGAFKAGLPAVFSARAVYTETSKYAHVSDPNAAYVGASFGATILYFFRVNFGVDYRIRGTGEHKVLYVWSAGMHFYLRDSIPRNR